MPLPARFARAGQLVLVGLLLIGCAATPQAIALTPTATPAVPPTVTAIALPPTATAIPDPASPTVNLAPPTAGLAPSPTPSPLPPPEQPAVAPSAAGTVILQLGAGSDTGQVGLAYDDNQQLIGPPSFRIGADGSIRILDALNKRILFYTGAGEFQRSLPVAKAVRPNDFIVNNAGAVFVYDQGQLRDGGSGFSGQRVLRYTPAGQVDLEIPISDEISGDGLMLSADQHLVLAQGNLTYYMLLREEVAVPPEAQRITRQQGAITPRSPVAFFSAVSDGTPQITIDPLLSGRALFASPIGLPPTLINTSFFNVDRAMNLYTTSLLAPSGPIDVWRVAPDGSLSGGARIATDACADFGWRSLYIDQEGAAWTLCKAAQGVSVTRYVLLSLAGEPLPPAEAVPAEVPWRPGASASAA